MSRPHTEVGLTPGGGACGFAAGSAGLACDGGCCGAGGCTTGFACVGGGSCASLAEARNVPESEVPAVRAPHRGTRVGVPRPGLCAAATTGHPRPAVRKANDRRNLRMELIEKDGARTVWSSPRLRPQRLVY